LSFSWRKLTGGNLLYGVYFTLAKIVSAVNLVSHVPKLLLYFCVESSKKYKYVKRERILPKVSVPSASAGSAAESASHTALFAGGGAKLPLSGMQFVVIGKTSKKKSDIGQAVAELGGKLVATVNDKVAACISTKGARNVLSVLSVKYKSFFFFIIGTLIRVLLC